MGGKLEEEREESMFSKLRIELSSLPPEGYNPRVLHVYKRATITTASSYQVCASVYV